MARRPEPSDRHGGPSRRQELDQRGAPELSTLTSSRVGPHAECQACDWHRSEADGALWLAVRAAAQRHVRATGHQVAAGVRTVYLYGLRAG